ncbi:hypothetical protein EU546_00680 [Candidatus Thorarchaeota archaeon]|nr:MAG: hypothetical protein EU546_00680 [Candidatus Thorarchaeota archaeon]
MTKVKRNPEDIGTRENSQYQVRFEMRKQDDKVVVWPQYLDSELTRNEGRRIPKNLAAPDIDIRILAKAAESIGFEYEIEPEKRYPRTPTRKTGYVLLENEQGHSKKRLLLMLAKGVRRIVAQREAARQRAQKKGAKRKRRR